MTRTQVEKLLATNAETLAQAYDLRDDIAQGCAGEPYFQEKMDRIERLIFDLLQAKADLENTLKTLSN